MRLRNAIKLLFSNFGVTYKVLLYKVIVYGLLTLIGGLIIVPVFRNFVIESKAGEVLSSLWGVVRSLFNAEADIKFTDARAEFTACFDFFRNYLKTNYEKAYIVIAVVGVLTLIGAFFAGIGDYAVGEIIDERMSSLSNRGFTVCLFKNLGKASLFSLVNLAIVLVFTAVMFGFNAILFALAFKYLGLVTVFLSVLSMLLLNAFRKTFLTDFMPNVVTGRMGVAQAFRKSVVLKKGEFGRLFSNYFTINILMLFMNVAFALCTFFTGLILTIPMATVMTLCFRFVSYYTLSGKKYYVSYDEIVTSKFAEEESDLIDKIDE